VAVAAVLVAAVPAPAAAYVRTRASAGAPEAWGGACVAFTVHLGDLPGASAEDVQQAVTAAAATWSAPAVDCTDLQVAVSFAEGPGPAAADDGLNAIGDRPDGWCTTESAPRAACASPSELALTTVFTRRGQGQIVGADIQLNTLAFLWGRLDGRGAGGPHRQDLQNALTHELGHALGLDHPCWTGVGPRATDDAGQPVPDCYDAPDEVQRSVMYPAVDPGDVSHRALSPEDVRAICAIYPRRAEGPAACPAPPPAGCATGGRATGAVGPLVLAALALARRRARRRRTAS
jgi:hypothetical protein